MFVCLLSLFCRSTERGQKFDPTTLKADTVSVELEIGPSVILLYGTALKNFMNFKVRVCSSDIRATINWHNINVLLKYFYLCSLCRILLI